MTVSGGDALGSKSRSEKGDGEAEAEEEQEDEGMAKLLGSRELACLLPSPGTPTTLLTGDVWHRAHHPHPQQQEHLALLPGCRNPLGCEEEGEILPRAPRRSSPSQGVCVSP